MTQAIKRIAENLADVRQTIEDAAARCGRSPNDVRLVAVTKYVSPELARGIYEAGCGDLAESRPQQLWDKSAVLADLPIRWHLIGHLQRNKLNRTLPHVHLLHSLDSIRLGKAVDDWARPQAVVVPALVEVNISGDPTKHGFSPDEVLGALEAATAWSHVEIRGLMGMASLIGGLDAARRDFARLRQLRDNIAQQLPDGPSLRDLSMGMSHDFAVAIEEGATIVRVGSALFEGIEL